ncbi:MULTISPECIES: glycosyltransferase [unclassified Mesorhizobium]|uniref:glycosyltransferase family protein n=1 Tax=unclassified Mesorhizobium TaxID=325217 RepID=UPI000FE7E4B4|nr:MULTISPECIES: glycosyltransferase [unclassified Mesorhizobium]RWI30093.1 MAG: glycosyltransferase [Mesorhizobium sp.]RWK53332.1 MAG: glycosyltransferase [Mesorhizobium sp.]RWK98463.1 MAG: glycosyltransferase [Mesorhizobium sp.]RWL13362.1 MAG: glycosyltransferase [Mesorhizobium sp.]TIP61438.1 MAG: glycosyltransferase family 4 protein [Mesorhizobium sp.]
MSNLKLVYAHPVPIPGQAANTVQVVKACSAFQAIGCRTVLAIPLDRPGTNKWSEIRKAYNPERRVGLWRIPFDHFPAQQLVFGGAVSLLAWLTARDAVITRSISVARVTAAAGRPTVLELHSPVEAERQAVIKRFHMLVKSKNLLSLVVISEALRKHFESRWPELSGRILSTPLGGDLVTEPTQGAIPLCGDFNVGYAGQLYPGKGMEIILPLAQACPWATFHIVGGAQHDIDQWRARAESERNIIFHGYVPHARIPSFLAAFDVALAPYQRVVRGVGNDATNLADWMSPLKAFEYMAHGKAILCSDLPVLQEIFTGGETALLCSPDDPMDWTRALTQLRDNTELRRRLGENARRRMEREFTREAWARKIAHDIGSRLHAGKRRRPIERSGAGQLGRNN